MVRIEVFNCQDRIDFSEGLRVRLEGVLNAVAGCLGGGGEVLDGLAELEVTLLDDEEMGRIHGEFLDDERPTDVITFEHGEIFLGMETARRQAEEFGNGFERELTLYGIHGLLHLSGYNDVELEGRLRMEKRQEELLEEFF